MVEHVVDGRRTAHVTAIVHQAGADARPAHVVLPTVVVRYVHVRQMPRTRQGELQEIQFACPGKANYQRVGEVVVVVVPVCRFLGPVDALLRLLDEEETVVDFIGHGMKPENVEMVLSHPLVMIGSDGSSMAPKGKVAETRPHPRSYGTCPRVLGHYARERKIFDLPTAVKKMTGMPAEKLGLTDRGRIARGMKADLVVFNAAEVRDTATFEDPHQYPQGIKYVLVNGTFVVENGRHTGARPGMVLRKT